MPERPDVGGNGVQVRLRKDDTAHRRHGAWMSLRLRHAVLDRRLEALQASVTPKPFPIRQIRSDRGSFAIRTMAAAAGAVRCFAVENAVSERDLLFCKALWQWKFVGDVASVRMDAFRRPSFRRVGRWHHALGCRRRGDRGFGVAALIGDAPNSSVHVVGDKERAVWGDGQTRRPERRATGIFRGAGKAIGKDDIVALCFCIGERLEYDIVPALRPGSSVPGAVERDESAALIGFREAIAEVDLHVVGRPMCRKERDRLLALRADADLLAAVAAVFRPEHQLSLCVIEIAFGPAVICALPQFDKLLGRQLLALPCYKGTGPLLAELVPPMLGGEDAAGRVK